MIYVGKRLRLNPPVTFSEKLQWLKLYGNKEEYTQMVDKYEVKKHVADIIGEEYIIPTLGVWDKFDDIDFEQLPNQFVLKCTHDSGGLVICKDKSKLDINAARKKLNKCLARNYYWQTREMPYKNVKPRIIAEKYMADESETELKDYKFFCFDGKVRLCQVISDRLSNEKIDFYDTDWNRLVGLVGLVGLSENVKNSDTEIIRPLNYNQMITNATKLSKNIPFVRIDQYKTKGGQIFFGEITFYPKSGMGNFKPDIWNYKLGEWIMRI
jgi:hypothetical protein